MFLGLLLKKSKMQKRPWGRQAMLDLFGHSNTSPYIPPSRRMPSLINAAYGFPEWWKAWPTNSRKVAKQQCLDKWARFECASSASLILAHTGWMKTQDDWLRDGGKFICAPLVYINQRRWDGWELPAPVLPKHDVLAELKAHKGSAPSLATLEKIAAIRKQARGV